MKNAVVWIAKWTTTTNGTVDFATPVCMLYFMLGHHHFKIKKDVGARNMTSIQEVTLDDHSLSIVNAYKNCVNQCCPTYQFHFSSLNSFHVISHSSVGPLRTLWTHMQLCYLATQLNFV